MNLDTRGRLKKRLFGPEPEVEERSLVRQMIESQLLGVNADPVVAPPATIDHYRILATLGSGGTGTVYSALDDRLDRRVAIKVIHPATDDAGRARILREAQALARLSHPNVVQVHEVAESEGRDYIVMELVTGVTLDRWLASPEPARRGWQARLQMVGDAGRGLAAAHAVGLVHRDFKPPNVIVGDDGRVRVLDFGLARDSQTFTPISEMDVTEEHDLLADTGTGRPASTLTSVSGTPDFMAPEQRRGRPATTLSDQYSFCVVLHQALFGSLPDDPFGPPSLPVRGGPPVPTWLRRALVRGLAVEPGERWPSMAALLAEIDRDRSKARKIGLVIVALLGVASVSAGLAGLTTENPLCVEEPLAAWSPERQLALREAFGRSGLPHADVTLGIVEARLDEQAQAIAIGRASACSARWITLAETDEQFELRNACLDQRDREFDATVDALIGADAHTLEYAFGVVEGLGDVDQCARTEALTRGWPVAKDEASRREVGLLRDRIARGDVLRLAERADEAWVIAREVEARADELGYAPLKAEALYLRGRLENRDENVQARSTMREAAVLAEEFDHLELAAKAWRVALITGEGAAAQASPEYLMAASALRRLDVPATSGRWVELAYALAYRLRMADDPQAALDVLDASFATLDDDELQRIAHGHLRAGILGSLGRAVEAEQSYESALALCDRKRGAASLQCARLELDLGVYTLRNDPTGPGAQHIRNARANLARVFSPSAPRVVMADLALANVELAAGNLDRAKAMTEDALTRLPVGHEDRNYPLDGLALIEFKRGDLAAAERLLDEAVATHLAAGRADHSRLAAVLELRGATRVRQGRFDEAIADLERADEIFTSIGAESADVVAVLGEAQLGAGDGASALRQFDRALELLAPDEAIDRADATWGRARALRALGRRQESRASAEQALAEWTAAAPDEPTLLDIRAFLSPQR